MKSMRLWIYRIITLLIPESRGFSAKCLLLRLAGAKIGRNVRIYSSARFIGTGTLEIGDDVHIGSGVFIATVSPYGVSIGNHVDIGPRVTLISGSHKLNPSDDPHDSSEYLCEHMAGEGTGASICVSDGCWLGSCSTILSGVELPRKTVVAAGSIVTHSLDKRDKCLWAGSPAIVKKVYS